MRLGIAVTDVRLAGDQPVGRAVMIASGSDGPLRIFALGRDEADAQVLTRAWRYLAYRDAPANLLATRRRQVEYEAYVMLLAAQEGVLTPEVVTAADRGGVAVLAVTEAEGASLDQLAPRQGAISDDLLERVWQQAARLCAARIAHGRLDAQHFVVAEDGTSLTVVGWDRAVTGATDHQIASDVAQLLAASAALVGDERAIAVAAKIMEAPMLLAALPWLQAPVLGWVTRDALERSGGVDANLERLSGLAAATMGVDRPSLEQRTRINPRRILMAVGALVGVGVLLSRVGDPVEFWNSIKDATWWYVALAFVLGLMTDVAFAFAFMGTVPIWLPVWPSIELQSSLSFANLAVPVAADTAMQIRFLQKNGLELSEAVATGGLLSSISEVIVQVALFGIALVLSPDTIQFGHIDTNQIVVVVLIVVFIVGVATALVFGVRRIRHVVLPAVVRAARAAWDAVKTPERIALMIGGNVAAQCFYAASLLACLAAFGSPVNFWTLLALNIGISLIASLVPIPGGGTAVSAIGLSGMLVTLGVPTAAATGAVLSHQVAVSYLPALPGWFASNDLARRGLL